MKKLDVGQKLGPKITSRLTDNFFNENLYSKYLSLKQWDFLNIKD